jgi:hypothetical protein
MLPYSPTSANTRMLPGPLSRLLARISAEQSRPDPTDLPAPVAVRCGAVVVDGPSMILRQVGASLELVIEDLSIELFRALIGPSQVPDEGAVVDLADGRQIVARFVGSFGRSMSASSTGCSSPSTFELSAWTLLPTQPSVAWIAPLPKLRVGCGNLMICGANGDWSRKSLRIEDRYALHVVETSGGSSVLVVDTHGEPLDVSVLAFEARALEIALGRHIPIAHALALGEGGEVIGAAGLSFGSENADSDRCPVPSHAAADPSWIAVFYRQMAKRLRDDKDSPLMFATAAYLDAVPARLDTANLLLLVALEGFCKAVAQADDEPQMLVKDASAWSSFIDTRRDKITELAVDDGAAKTLMRRLRECQRASRPTTDLVEAVRRAVGVDAGDEIFADVREWRNQAAHNYFTSPESCRDWRRDLVRIGKTQTLLIAAMAKYIGYTGPIVGWETNRQGWPTVPSWWTWDDDPLAHALFVADVAARPAGLAND